MKGLVLAPSQFHVCQQLGLHCPMREIRFPPFSDSIIAQDRGLSNTPLLIFWAALLSVGTVLSWALEEKLPWPPPPRCKQHLLDMMAKTVSTHCELSLGSQNHMYSQVPTLG